ncbi:MAG: hypothetical protein JO297_17545 [Nitrososphaeraceae archaeon]|nr:hypothetical protein [Nitrososphaeraceae archaeon]
MSIDKKNRQFLIKIEPLLTDEDKEELERITHNLRNELKELDMVEDVDLAKEGQAPKGSKVGIDIFTIGSLIVTLASSSVVRNVFPTFVNTLRSWITRNENHKISLEIDGDKLEVTAISDKEKEKLIDAWISRHTEKV